MTETRIITCDQCARQIAYSLNPQYGIKLEAVERRPQGEPGFFEAKPWPRAPRHFCGFACLRGWVEQEARTQ